jgi:hypothetical protein
VPGIIFTLISHGLTIRFRRSLSSEHNRDLERISIDAAELFAESLRPTFDPLYHRSDHAEYLYRRCRAFLRSHSSADVRLTSSSMHRSRTLDAYSKMVKVCPAKDSARDGISRQQQGIFSSEDSWPLILLKMCCVLSSKTTPKICLRP